MNREWVYGRQAVREVFRAGRRSVFSVRVAKGVQEQGTLAEILSLARQTNVPIEPVDREQLDRLGANHQGVAIQTEEYPQTELSDLLENCTRAGTTALVLLLDQIQDPQNLATLLRTAEAVGVGGVVLPAHRAASVTPAVVNASAGATEHLLIAGSNLAQAIQTLKEAGIWIAGLDSSPDLQSIFDADLAIPLALVVGSEGEGMRPLTRKSCDFLFRLPMIGKIGSLNAAMAGSVALYMAFQARQKRA